MFTNVFGHRFYLSLWIRDTWGKLEHECFGDWSLYTQSRDHLSLSHLALLPKFQRFPSFCSVYIHSGVCKAFKWTGWPEQWGIKHFEHSKALDMALHVNFCSSTVDNRSTRSCHYLRMCRLCVSWAWRHCRLAAAVSLLPQCYTCPCACCLWLTGGPQRGLFLSYNMSHVTCQWHLLDTPDRLRQTVRHISLNREDIKLNLHA